MDESITIAAGQTGRLDSYDIRPKIGRVSRKIFGFVYLWSNGGGCVATDTIVWSTYLITLTLRNIVSTTITVSDIRALVVVGPLA